MHVIVHPHPLKQKLDCWTKKQGYLKNLVSQAINLSMQTKGQKLISITV